MAAIIRSFRNGVTPLDGVSRDDLVEGDIVLLTAVDAHSTYNWVIAFAPETSAATFSGSATAASPGMFIADVEGPYLIKLTVDAGEVTEDTQFVRLRSKTAFGSLCLVAAGERRDDSGIIPVDVDVEGWANEQNFNLVTLKDFVKPLVASGRLLYVDANDGTSNYADHSTVQAAITAASFAGASDSEQWVVAVRPGVYVEDVTFEPYIHVVGWPGNIDGRSSDAVILRTATATGHEAAIPAGRALVSGLNLESTTVGTNAVLRKTGVGSLRMHRVRVEQLGVSPTQGAAVDLQGGSLRVEDSVLLTDSSNPADRVAFLQSGVSTSSSFLRTDLNAPSPVDLNPGLVVTQSAIFDACQFVGRNASGWGLRSSAQELEVSRSTFDVPSGALGSAVWIHPSAGALVGNINATLRFTSVVGNINFDTTGVAGTSTLNTSGVEYNALVFPGTDPDLNALAQSKSHFYDNTITGLMAENVQDAIDEIAAVAAVAPVVYHKNMPRVPNDTVRYRGWAPVAAELIFVRVYMQTVNTQGNYTLAVTNEATGNTVLSAATFDMNSIVAGAVTAVPLSGSLPDLTFSAQDKWTVELVSDDLNFDGDAIYVSVVFNTATGGGPVTEDWATVLVAGNISGGTNPVISSNDAMIFEDSPAAPVSVSNTGRLRYNQATTSFQTSVDAGPWADIGTGSGGGGSPFLIKNVPVLPNNTYRFEGWVPIGAVVSDISVRMDVLNTQGNYTAIFTNETTGQTMLVGASYDMNTLVMGAVTSLSLTGTAADLTFSAGDEWSAEFISDDLLFDGDGIYFSMLFGTEATVTVSGAPPDDHQLEVTVFPANTINTLFFPPYDCTVTDIKVYGEVTPTTAGVYTLAVEEVSSSNNLLGAATFDLTGLPPTTLVSAALTGIPANLQLTEGSPVQLQFVSDNADLVASGLYAQIIYIGGSNDDSQFEMTVSASDTINHVFFAPYDMQILAIKIYGQVTPTTAGVYTLAVEDIDGANNLLGAPTFDMTSLTAATQTTLGLTGTGPDLQISEGTRVQFQLVSDTGDLVASGIYAQIIFRSQ